MKREKAQNVYIDSFNLSYKFLEGVTVWGGNRPDWPTGAYDLVYIKPGLN